jgi:hypothetical protein
LSWRTSESRVGKAKTRLDEFIPVWQFSERHTIEIDAPPSLVFEAIKRVRADEVFLFRTLTWIRRGGRRLPQSILNPGAREPLIGVALKSGFVKLAEEPDREVVIGMAVIAPPGAHRQITSGAFKTALAPGYALAAMNFVVLPVGSNRSVVTTETRVYANNEAARRKFARYWRVIYPGSAFIRRMWLRAVRRRATTEAIP